MVKMFEGLKKKIFDAVHSFSSSEEKKIEAEEGISEPKNNAGQEQQVHQGSEPQQESQYVPEHAEPEAERPAVDEESGKEEAQSAANANFKASGPQNSVQKDKLKFSFSTRARAAVFKKVKLSCSDIDNFADALTFSMLQADVSYETTALFSEQIKKELSDAEFSSKDVKAPLYAYVKKALLGILKKPGSLDFMSFMLERAKAGQLPVKVLFIGANGTGKTTTIAKIAYMLNKNGITSVLSASDTFRAAAIEQTEHHAKALGMPVIKSAYGADPASIAYDAVAYAKAHGIQAVLIDSAGRQETNKNLINELKKIARVVSPDLVIYVGESTSGSAIVNQINEFSKFIKIDGIILTKLDCDAKGGNAISIASTAGIPILFFGTGEAYTDLMPYDPNQIVNAILP